MSLPRRRNGAIDGRKIAVEKWSPALETALSVSVKQTGEPHVARTAYMSRCNFVRSCDHSARGSLSLSTVVPCLDVSYR